MRIRLVKPEDKDYVFSWITADDYIRDVWDNWVKDGNFYCIDEDGVIGILHLRWINEEVVWLEGIRIHPKHRRRGLATKLTEYAMAVARLHGYRWAMLLIISRNTPSMKLAEKIGFRRVAEFLTFRSELFLEKHACQKALWADVKDLPGLNKNNYVVGNPEEAWSFIWLTETLLNRFAENGVAFGVKNGFILIGRTEEWMDHLHISYLEADNIRAAKTLLGCASNIALKRGRNKLFGVAPQPGKTAHFLGELGVKVRDDRALYVYAYNLLKHPWF